MAARKLALTAARGPAMVVRRGRKDIHQRHGVESRAPAAPRGHQPSLRRRAGRARHQSRCRGGELVALLGQSGCGKSTLLRIVSGFIRQSSGRVLFDGEPVDHLPPSRRGAGIVFQNYALFPHMTVAENVAYGLEAHKWPRQRIGPRVAEMLSLVHMSEFAT